jgi:hypothetical protein
MYGAGIIPVSEKDPRKQKKKIPTAQFSWLKNVHPFFPLTQSRSVELTMHACMYACMYVCMYVCMLVWMYVPILGEMHLILCKKDQQLVLKALILKAE